MEGCSLAITSHLPKGTKKLKTHATKFNDREQTLWIDAICSTNQEGLEKADLGFSPRLIQKGRHRPKHFLYNTTKHRYHISTGRSLQYRGLFFTGKARSSFSIGARTCNMYACMHRKLTKHLEE